MSSVVRLVCLVSLTTLLTACGGGGDDAVEDAGSRPNSFPGNKNPSDGFSESSTGDTSNSNGLEKNQVRITVEVPSSMAPSAPLSRRNLRLVQPDSISVYRTNQTLRQVASIDTERGVDNDGLDIIEFPESQPLGPDVLIEVSYNGTRIRAFATDQDQDIKVNPFSEYAVRYGLGGYSQDEFEAVMDCVSSSDEALCINKIVWSILADQIQDFEIDIPDGNTLNSAVELLADRADFAGYVDDMSGLAQIPADVSDVIAANSVDMNTVFFGLELGRSNRFSDQFASQWGTLRGYEEKLESSGTAYIYPVLSMASFQVFNINVTSMASDIPYERATLTRFPSNAYDARGREFWGINSHATSPSAASIGNDTRLMTGQSLYQSITNKGSAQLIGWSRNPFYRDAHLTLLNSSPNALLSSYFSGGTAIELEGSSGDYERGAKLEEHFTSVFDFSLTQSTAFQISSLANDYSVVSFSVQLGKSPSPFKASSYIGDWSGTSASYNQTIKTLEIARSDNGTVVTTPSAVTGPETVTVANRTSETSAGNKNNGRLNVAVGGSQAGIGASNPDGSIIAFNLDNSTDGNGILIGLSGASSSPDANTSYRLQGTIAGLGSDTNYLRQIKGGQLSFINGTAAEISLAGLEVEQEISTRNLTRPQRLNAPSTELTYTTTDSLSLTDGGNLSLDGFVSNDKEYLVLRVRNASGSGEEYLGLLLGIREE